MQCFSERFEIKHDEPVIFLQSLQKLTVLEVSGVWQRFFSKLFYNTFVLVDLKMEHI